MNDAYYLTEDIYIQNHQMYIKNRKITKNNWHHNLNNYGWTKMPLSWIKKLNTLSSKQNKNSRYGIFDCETDGNCLFHCIANAFNEKYKEKGESYDYKDIRNLIANSITEEQFESVIQYYRIMEDANDFDEEWDPYEIKNIDDFKRQLRKSGNNYWGDYLLLNIITEVLQLNIIILNYNNDCSLYNTLIHFNPCYNTIFLLYVDNCHFQLIGYFDNIIKSLFSKDEIPEELNQLIQLN